MAVTCSATIDGFGNRCVKESNIGLTELLLLTTPDFSFTSGSTAVTEAAMLEGIRDKKVFPIPGILEVENANIEDGVYTSPTGKETKLFEGRRGNIYRVNYDLATHQILKTYEKKNWKLFKVETFGKILGTSSNGTLIEGLTIQEMRVSTQKDGQSDTPAWTEIKIIEQNTLEWDERGVILEDLPYDALSLEGVNKVTISQVANVAANVFQLDISLVDTSRYNGGSSGANYSYDITGLATQTDSFELVDAGTGAVTNPTTVTLVSGYTNRYELTFVSAVATDTVRVKPQADRDLLHESAFLTLT